MIQGLRHGEIKEEWTKNTKISCEEYVVYRRKKIGCFSRKRGRMIKKPLFMSVPNVRDFEQYKIEAARIDGWNDAMRYIFGIELHATELKASCWVVKNYGEKMCIHCQNREVCALAMNESVLDYTKEL